MKRFVKILGGGFLAAGLSIAAFAHEGEHKKKGEEGKEVTVIGELIDTACFVASDGDAKGADHAECATKCMASGVPAGILPKDAKDATAMLFLLTNPKPLAAHASHTVKAVGTVHKNMHAMDVKKLYMQDGSNWKEIQLNDEHHKMGGGADAAAGDHAGHGRGAKHDHKK